jgi:hypothetical protein
MTDKPRVFLDANAWQEGLMRPREIAMRYDAHKQPDPQAWLELDEPERIDLGIDDRLRSKAGLDSMR